jgi:TP901 family phage tail tape measure protein
MARVELNIVALGDFTSVNTQIANLKTQVELLNKSLVGVGISSNLSKQLQEANSAFKATMLSTGQFTASTVTLKSETEKFGAALSTGKLKLGEYFKIIKAGTASATAEMKALAIEQTKLQNSMVMSDPTKQGVMSVFTPTKINEVANATKIAANMQNVYNIAVDKGTESLIKWGKNTQWAGRQLTVGMTVPLTIFGTTAVQTFQQVNDELVRLQKVYGTGLQQPTQQTLDAIKSQVLGLSKELASSMGIAAKDTAAMAADLAATGKQGNDLLVATREAMRLTKLGEMSTQDAMQTTISLQNVYKLSTDQLSGAVNFLNAVENQTSTSLQDLAAGIPKVGPIVQQLGGSFKDTAVMMVAMKEAGVPAAQSANAIKSALASLINPTKAAKEAFAAYNINLGAIATTTKGNPIQMIEMLQKSLNGLQPLQQAQLIEKLFGKFQEARIQALITNLGAVNSQTKQAFDLAQATDQQLSGIAAGELKTATESTTGKFKRAIETMKADLLPVGEKIMQIATTLLNFGNSVAKVFSGLPGPVKAVMGFVAAGVALSGPLIMFTGVLANFVGYLMKGVFSLASLFKGTKSFGELFTPEIIASQNAAQLFSNKIMEDESAVSLLNKAVQELTVSLQGMSSAMVASSTTNFAEKIIAAEAGLAGGKIPFKAPGMASGGIVPGTGNSDSYPAMLTPGEMVVPKEETRKYGSFLSAIINGNLPGYKTGNNEYKSVLTHAGAPIDPASEEGMALLEKRPELASAVKRYGDRMKILSLLTSRLPQSVNKAMDTEEEGKGATINDFEKGWQSQKPLRFLDSLRKSGMSHEESKTPEMIESQKKFDAEILKRVLQLKEQNKLGGETTINDKKYYEIVKDTINHFKNLNGSEKRLGEVLDQASKTYGGYRTEFSKTEIQDMRKNEGAYIPENRKTIIKDKYGFSIGQAYKGASEKGLSVNSYGYTKGSKSLEEIDQVRNIAAQKEEVFANQLNVASQSQSPSKATAKAAQNMVDGVTVTLKEGAQKTKIAAEEIAAAGQSWVPKAEGPLMENGSFVKNPGILGRVKGRLVNSEGNLSMGAKMGGSMALMMGGQAIESMLPKGGVASSLLGSASSMGGMGMMFGPWGAAAGAALGLVTGGIGALMKAEKEHEATVKASFTASTDAINLFGGTVIAKNTSVITFNDSLKGTGADAIAAKSGIDQLVDSISKLPKEDPVKKTAEAIKGYSDKSTIGTLQQQAASMVAGGMDPAKVKDMVTAMLQYAGKSNLTATALKQILPATKDVATAQETLTKKLVAAADPIKTNGAYSVYLGESYKDLGPKLQNVASHMADLAIQAASNSTSSKDSTAAIKALGATGYDSGQQLAMLVAGLKNADQSQLADRMVKINSATKDLGVSLKIAKIAAAGLLANQTVKVDGKTVNLDTPNGWRYLQEHPEILKNYLDQLDKANKKKADVTGSTPPTTLPGVDAVDPSVALQKKYKTLLEDVQKRLDKEKAIQASMDAQNNAAQHAIDYATQMTDLQNQIKQKIATGDYLGANLLNQQSLGVTDKYNMQAISDQNKQKIDALNEMLQSAQSQIANGKDLTAAQVKSLKTYNPTLGTYNVGSVNVPAATTYGTASQMGTTQTNNNSPTFNLVFNGADPKANWEYFQSQLKIYNGKYGTNYAIGGK